MDKEYLNTVLREALLNEGEMPSMLFIEQPDPDHTIHVMPVPYAFSAGGSESRILFRCGQLFGITHRWKPASVAWAVQGWIARATQEDFEQQRIPTDTERKEVLACVYMMCEQDLSQELFLTEILRDGQGKLVDLLVLRQKPRIIDANHLPAFLAGVMYAQRISQTVFTEAERVSLEKLAALMNSGLGEEPNKQN